MNTARRAAELAYNRNISLVKLAERSGISYQTFMAANRRNSQLSVETIERVCSALGISLCEFFDCEDGRACLSEGS